MFYTGVTSVSFRQKDVSQIIEAAAAAGLQGIEWGSDVHVPAGDLQTARQVEACTRQAGLKVLSYGGYYRLGQPLQELQKLLQSAETLQVKQVRIWGGTQDSGELDAKAWSDLVQIAQEAAKLAAAKGMVLSLECHNQTVTDDWSAALRFLQQVNAPNLRMYWQPNQLKTADYNTQAVQQLLPWLTNVHVFSWTAQERLPLQAQRALWLSWLKVLQNGVDRALILEFMHDDRLETLAQTAAELNNWVETLTHEKP